MKTVIFGLLSVVAASGVALAQTPQAPDYELLCRMKAKEVAANSYRGCMTESRAQHIDQLKKEYQEKLRAMKNEYESELKRLAPSKSNASTMPSKKQPGKKMAKLKASAKPTPIAKPEGTMEDITVESKNTMLPTADESMLDIPEPTPIEDVPTIGG